MFRSPRLPYWRIPRPGEIPPSQVTACGNRYWYDANGEFHRDGGLPAAEAADGSKAWWWHGQRHRANDLPAVEYPDGTRFWFFEGRLHREGGKPAAEYPNGRKYWYIHGVEQEPPDAQET